MPNIPRNTESEELPEILNFSGNQLAKQMCVTMLQPRCITPWEKRHSAPQDHAQYWEHSSEVSRQLSFCGHTYASATTPNNLQQDTNRHHGLCFHVSVGTLTQQNRKQQELFLLSLSPFRAGTMFCHLLSRKRPIKQGLLIESHSLIYGKCFMACKYNIQRICIV